MTEWQTPTGYTGGEQILFWDGEEMIELRMVDDLLSTAAQAALSLKARFFFKKVGHDAEQDLPIWAAYDRETVKRFTNSTQIEPPKKTFTTDDTAPLIMWAAAKGGR